MVVLDASFAIDALAGDGPWSVRMRNQIADEHLVAPALFDVEVMTGLRRQVLGGQVPPWRAEEAVQALKLMDVERIPHEPELDRMWELRDNLTAQDAAYVAVAESLDAPLLTTDARLARAPGPRCEIRLATSRGSS